MERFAIKIDRKLKANLYKICRLCGIDNPDMVPILTDNQEKHENAAIDVEAEMEMHQKINLLIGLMVTKDDRMPQTMCCLCVDKINDFYEFREMCYATNAQTRKLLGLKNIKKPAADIKPKVEVKEECIVPTSNTAPTPAVNKNGNRKRKTEEVALKEEIPAVPAVLPKKKLRFSTPAESTVKEEAPVVTKKKLRFTVLNDEPTPPAASSTKKSKNAPTDDTKLKKEPSPPVPAPAPAVSNKKLRLAAPPQKEAATKKSKQKGGKNAEQKELDVKEEIKEEIKVEPAPVAASAPAVKVPPAPKLKFGCNICKERFAAKVNLEAHNRTSHLPKIERYVCTACNEVLSKSFDIKNHQLWHKLSKTPYICGCCGESILNTYAFSRHLREHAFETPPALLVLDRECPQCHTSYATNFLYNIHICAVKTRRCAGCNRLQRNEAEYLKHSAQCAKVYLNYSKHIMPSVEALEDAVRIKNENDVEAAAEEMARISGLPLDMAPVVQLTRLSSPLIMAANHCVSTTGLDDAASTSSKKSGKKGVSKKELKRVDELLKSTLDALVSIKHEPEVHVEQETPCAGEHSDNDDHNERHEEAQADDHVGSLDDSHHHNADDSDNDDEEANMATNVTVKTSVTTETAMEQIKIKQEIDETNEENANKIGGGGLKLKIKKEHGQLNSSIIEQQKSSDKRAEKRKKKKKHKDKEKDKQKLSKDMHDEHASQDSNANNNTEENVVTLTPIRIKAEPEDGSDAADMSSVATPIQIRPHPEATIMTSIPMMQFQIACVSSGVEFNSGAASAVVETEKPVPPANHETEPEDVKPNREELDRMLKISHVSSGIAMETGEAEETEEQPMDHDGNDDEGNGGDEDEEDEDYQEESNEDDHHDDNDNESENQVDNQSDHIDDEQEDDADAQEAEEEEENDKDIDKTSEDTGIDNEEIIAKKIKKPLLKPKSKLTLKPKVKETPTIAKSRNKACKSTAKPPNMPVLQISAVRSGVTLDPSAPSASDFIPIFIKPEPQNRGYSDEQTLVEQPPPQPEIADPQDEETEELSRSHSAEEQNYISSIDFNNITIKQEKGIEINDVQISQKSVKSYADLNGIKRKRKPVRRAHTVKDKTLKKGENGENNDANMDEDEEHETDEEIEDEENDDEEMEEEGEEEEDVEEEEDEEDEEEDEEEEEREYRELEYPPELHETKEHQAETDDEEINKTLDETQASKQVLVNETQMNVSIKENIDDTNQVVDSNMTVLSPPNEKPSLVIASVCSQAPIGTLENVDLSNNDKVNMDQNQVLTNHNDNLLTPPTVIDANESNLPQILDPSSANENAIQEPSHGVEIVMSEIPCPNNTLTEPTTLTQGNSAVAGSSQNSDFAIGHASTAISNVPVIHKDSNITITSSETQAENAHPLPPTLPTPELQENIHTNEISLQLGQPFEVRPDGQIPHDLNPSQEPNISDSTLQSSQITQISGPLAQDQLSTIPGTQIMQNIAQELQYAEQNPQENAGQAYRQESQSPHQTSQDNVQYPQQGDINSQTNIPQNTLQCSGEEAQITQECNRPNSQELQHVGQENPPLVHRLDSQDQQQPQHPQRTFEHTEQDAQDPSYVGQSTHDHEPQPHTSQDLQPVFKISSVTSVVPDITPEFNSNPLSNNNDQEVLKDNQEETATIEGVVEQAKDLNLEAQPVRETPQNLQNFNNESGVVNEMEVDENYENDEEEGNEDENEEDEDNVIDDDAILCNNLEERQNYQNQEVLTQIRPAALALHPYLEDISSSSNSLLSNSLSQTPPPPSQQASARTSTACAERRLLNTEETENILNESSDALSRRSTEVAATSAVSAGQPLPQPLLAQQLPPHMPTFNFDNINEIAENNNNANIEREQLQDEQQQQQNQQQTTNTQ